MLIGFIKVIREIYLFFRKLGYLCIISVFCNCFILFIEWDILSMCKSFCLFFIYNFVIKKYECDINKI